MHVSYNWLKEYVDIDLSPADLAERLTMVGLEVEEVEDRYHYLEDVVVARVVLVEDHPKASHLKICRVDDGAETRQVLCGAPNVRQGMFSVLARPGTRLPSGDTVSEAEIRGIVSSGMLCSEIELMVGPDASGIIEISNPDDLGRNLKNVLGLEDWIFEIGITPNRPDCLSMLGVAREVAGMLGREVKMPETKIEEGPARIDDLTSVRILAPDHCPRYTARVIQGVKIGPSPFWMVERLVASGVRSINNVVDITNYVLLETGQPLHAFDMDFLVENRIEVKLAQEGDKFTTLDEEERILGPETLMICDGKKPVGLAGVMGGLNSEIKEQTTNVLLESAYFDPVSIRRTSKNLGVSTEASFRFERGNDPNLCVIASNRAIGLMAELAGGQVAQGVIDVHPKPYRKISIPFSPAKCNALLGTAFSAREMQAKMEGIGLEVSGEGDELQVVPPSFRPDLEREVDLFEEVARLVGYNQVEATIPSVRTAPAPPDPMWQLRARGRKLLEGMGLYEIINYSFINENFPDKLRLPEDDRRRKVVRIINPLSEDQALMRTSLVPGILDVCRRNQFHSIWEIGIFEIGKTYFDRPGEDLPEECWTIGALLAGNRTGDTWHTKAEPVDFYDIKGLAEELLDGLNLPEAVFEGQTPPSYYNTQAAARISVGDVVLGWVGEVDPQVTRAFDLRDRAFIFELDLEAVMSVRNGVPQFNALPRFPSVERDMAVILDRQVPAASIIHFIRGLEEPFLNQISVFDAFEGEKLGANKKSLGFRIEYRSADRTLTDEEINAVHQQITGQVLSQFGAELP